MRHVEVERGGASLAEALFDDICDLYDDVFSRSPFYWRDDESDLHRERLRSLTEDRSFGIAVARDGNTLVGFAYGFALPADTKRWERLTEPLPDEVTSEWPGRTFVLFDYAVDVAHRGRGIGRRLHDALLGSRPEERATLSVQPSALDTKRIYERWGWRHVGQAEGGPTAAVPVFDTYLRDRLDDLRAGHATNP